MLAKEEKDRLKASEILNMHEFQALLYGNYFKFIKNSHLTDQVKNGMIKMMKQLFNPTLINEILPDFEKWKEEEKIVFQNA